MRSDHPDVQCVSFVCPLEAMEILISELIIAPKYIFIDINMPRMPGKKCLRELRKLSQFDSTVITILSTSVNQAETAELRGLGANYVFEKPAEFILLREMLDQIIRQKPAA